MPKQPEQPVQIRPFRCVECKDLVGPDDVLSRYDLGPSLDESTERCLCVRCVAKLPGLSVELAGHAVDGDDLLDPEVPAPVESGGPDYEQYTG